MKCNTKVVGCIIKCGFSLELEEDFGLDSYEIMAMEVYVEQMEMEEFEQLNLEDEYTEDYDEEYSFE